MKKEVKILVVDDEKEVLDFLKEVVERQGYSFLQATSGKEAINKIKKARPNLVILDIVMPGLDGLEVLRRIRRKDKKLPVVIITAYGKDARVDEAMKLNIFGVIFKGASVKEIASGIEAALDITLK